MSDPSNPTYSIAESNPEPEIPPQHPFVAPEKGALLPCQHEIMRLESGHIVRCGLHRRHHQLRLHAGVVNQLWDRTDGP